mmetsp:Transcript_35240/g.81247  ORF Transcript_35240/g.81247 Transcript_35240/m.81247 type:complete len:514 (-) Transcript_35240:108-1649(-)
MSTISPRHFDDEVDDVTVGLQVQQFLDEWHFRVLHSGLAYAWDRPEALIKAMDIFEASGMHITQEEKEQLAQLDEEWMIEGLVQRMPGAMKKTIEHFLLQLQLVLSTATRVRNALEEGSPDEVAKIMEDGDTGITQQVLKEVVTEAGREVGELQSVHQSWDTSMALRIARLVRCSEEADQAAIDLEQVQLSIEKFPKEQNAKTTKVMLSMIENRKRGLLALAFVGWTSHTGKSRLEKRLDAKFSAEVEQLESKLYECKAAQLGTVRSVMDRKAVEDLEALLTDIFATWKRYVYLEADSREVVGKLKAARAKLTTAKATQKENAKKSLVRMTEGEDDALMALVLGAWVNWLAEYRKNKEFEHAVKASEAKVREYMQRKTQNAREMLVRLQGSTETGLLSSAFNAWAEDYKAVARVREVEATVDSQQHVLKELNTRQKVVATGIAKQNATMQDDILLTQIFMNWYTEVRTEHVRRHYMGKMDTKEQKFEAVQTMIKSFANQLEQGIGNSPRSRRT